ncbi:MULTISPECIES: ATP-binding protein [unclassified Microcoleus]|uniref:sensor histidine kinase n=1 Tax=unclassified Microcoleus TaxID=2642155 RepID=UPI001D8C02EE|nr:MULTISPECIES: ATP-binding protein [unclassified Microcoleus]MCC3429605.1 ATP-binding protein [Microcoleus sp. PH2017_04_SCI_O_A]MCC3440315.1 ATP-binding protein [Microcoleus sp. PH2017_03_ELD_O_A]MCC3465784.1 ATP-binding protein [Microcoleus sp. PH2017_06_SFM_O_A]TAG42366.1 MAG: ATP-binding protein [Oscillatoriales cyanobacterium]MCC3412092.1 ATP-binding protein [Microcoleus sp. PH2017_02_FOX_O_A]
MLNTSCIERPVQPLSQADLGELSLDSTLVELSLYAFNVEATDLGMQISQMLEANPLLPGVILTDRGEFAGMISRRRFLEFLSRPFGRELFLKRPVRALYRFAQTETLIFPSNTLIVDAARKSLLRSKELLYEPIVVQVSPQNYSLVDVHELLVAQSNIHELATKLLRQQTQSQLIQTEKLASLGQMVAGVAHEIRNPVTCISGNLGFLSNYSKDILQLLTAYEQIVGPSAQIDELKEDIEFDFLQEDWAEILKSMKVSSERLTELVTSLHTFSHMDETHLKESNIHECIDSTLLIMKNRLKYGFKVVKSYGNLPLVKCYSGQLSQVFMNIVSNAMDALEELKGTKGFVPAITIQTEVINSADGDCVSSELMQNYVLGDGVPPRKLRQNTKLRSSASQNGDFSPEAAGKNPNNAWIAIRIADNGPGIAPEIQRRIFETFFTTKPAGKGTGLGLAITHQIVTEKHKGKLNLHSTPGTGTEFEILLPLI